MTARLKGFVVTFDKDIREDDAEELRKAIGLMRGVSTVDPVPSNIDDHINQRRVRRDLEQRIFDVLHAENGHVEKAR